MIVLYIYTDRAEKNAMLDRSYKREQLSSHVHHYTLKEEHEPAATDNTTNNNSSNTTSAMVETVS